MLKVSVIIPVLNEEVAVVAAIKSARSAGADEIFVVDGGSTDNTFAVATAHAGVIVAPSPGRSAQQNIGADHATGDVLLFLHADCCLNSGAIVELKNRMVSDSNIVAGCFRQRIDEPGLAFRCLEAGNHSRAAVLKWAYGDQAIFVRADTFQEIGGFPAMKFMEDLFLMKILKRRGRIVVLNSPLLVSARRWKRRGVFLQTLRNWCLIAAAQMGVSPDRLARFYPNDR